MIIINPNNNNKKQYNNMILVCNLVKYGFILILQIFEQLFSLVLKFLTV